MERKWEQKPSNLPEGEVQRTFPGHEMYRTRRIDAELVEEKEEGTRESPSLLLLPAPPGALRSSPGGQLQGAPSAVPQGHIRGFNRGRSHASLLRANVCGGMLSAAATSKDRNTLALMALSRFDRICGRMSTW